MDKAETNMKFFGLIGDLELREEGVCDLVSLDEIQNQILQSLNEHLQIVGDISIDQEQAYMEVTQALSDMINREIAHTNFIQYDDELISTGDIIYMVIDEAGETADILALQDKSRLRGNYQVTVVTKTPDSSVMMEASNDYGDEYNAVPHTDFGAAFLLSNVKITHEDGSEEIIPEEKTFLVPLSFIPLPLKKVLPLSGE